MTRTFADAADIWTPGECCENRSRIASHRSGASRSIPKAEALSLPPESLDLAVSALAFQFVNDLPGVLAQIRRALKPDGLLLAAMIGGDTLSELRQAFAEAEAESEGGVSPRVAPFADLRDIGALLQRAGFALPVTDVDSLVVRYDSAFALMAGSQADGRHQRHGRAAPDADPAHHDGADGADLRERFADPDGRIRATFDIVWLSGWAPHESQQQPLRPGSAKASLAEAVKGKKRRDRVPDAVQRTSRCSAEPGSTPRRRWTGSAADHAASAARCAASGSAPYSSKSIKCGISGMSAGGIG